MVGVFMQAWAYVRVSGDEQGERGRQEAAKSDAPSRSTPSVPALFCWFVLCQPPMTL